jgi:hypothetical protein
MKAALSYKPTAYTAEEWQPELLKPQEFFSSFQTDCLNRTVSLSGYMAEVQMTPQDLLPVLQRAKVDYVLLGLYGIVGWTKEPRATEDVDVLVSKRHQKLARKALAEAFPDLIAKETPVMVRFFRGNTAVLDLLKPFHPLFTETLKNACEKDLGALKVRVPVLEMALALKFFAMTSSGRQADDKYQDAHDFIRLVKANTSIDVVKAHKWGELAFSGGGAEISKHIQDARAGKMLEL